MHTPSCFRRICTCHTRCRAGPYRLLLGSVEEVDKMTARLKLLKGAEVKHLDGPAGPAMAITRAPSSTRKATDWSSPSNT